MAVKPVQKFGRTGGTPTRTSASSGGDSFALQSTQQKFDFANSSGAPITVTFHAAKPCNQGLTHNATVSVPNGGGIVVEGFSPDIYGDDNGRVQLTYSTEVGLTLTSY